MATSVDYDHDLETSYSKEFIPLESNPEVMTNLGHRLGLSSTIGFQDLYSLYDRSLIDFVPDPLALLLIYPETPTSKAFGHAQKAAGHPDYTGSGPDEPVVFFRQTIRNACGLIGLLHCVTNNPQFIEKGSNLAKLLEEALPLKRDERAKLLVESKVLEAAHSDAAQKGDTVAPEPGEDPGHGYIAFVKGKDGDLWQLPGPDWKNPVKLGAISGTVLDEDALNLGPRKYVQREGDSGNFNFHCLVLAPL
jgi:ubiquitin carboxyl-terminal hydrolase L3